MAFHKARLFTAAVLAAVIQFAPSRGEAPCAPLTMVASVDIKRVDTDVVVPVMIAVPVTIAGVEKRMLLDFNSSHSTISEKAATDLGLPIATSGHNTMGPSRTASVSIGQYQVQQLDMLEVSSAYPGDIVGSIGMNFFDPVDISIDFGTLHMDLLRQDHCEGRVKYWKEEPFSAIPYQHAAIKAVFDETPIFKGKKNVTVLLPMPTILIPVEVDGWKTSAILSLDKPNTFIHMPPKQYRIHMTEQPENYRDDYFAKIMPKPYAFKTIKFGDVRIDNPVLRVLPDLQDDDLKLRKLVPYPLLHRRFPTHARSTFEEIGFDILSKLRIYIANKEKKIYVSPSAASSSPAQPKTASPAQ